MVEAPPLLAWLRAQIDADLWVADHARRVSRESWTPVGLQSQFDARVDDHIATWDPRRALAECAAKRRVLTRHAPQQVVQHAGVRVCRCCAHIWPCPDVLDVAVVYQDRDGWHDGWAPRG